jgi:thioredoxin reductase (NADPH)
MSTIGDYRGVQVATGEEYCAWATLLALGSTYRKLGIPGEQDYLGAGVHFCATCDGPFYRDQDVLVVGGGNSAGEESLFLTRFASKVTLVTSAPALTASRVVAEKVLAHPQIEVITGAAPVEFRGDSRLRSVVIRPVGGGAERELRPAGVFVFVGLTPNTKLVKDLLNLDQFGFVLTDAGLQTSLPGVYAAGDCRSGSTKQAASAAGEGAAAALSLRRYLETRAGGIPQHAGEAAG